MATPGAGLMATENDTRWVHEQLAALPPDERTAFLCDVVHSRRGPTPGTVPRPDAVFVAVDCMLTIAREEAVASAFAEVIELAGERPTVDGPLPPPGGAAWAWWVWESSPAEHRAAVMDIILKDGTEFPPGQPVTAEAKRVAQLLRMVSRLVVGRDWARS